MKKAKRMRSERKPESDLDNLRVVLVRTRNPLNIGAVARAMSNFGARHLRLVQPYEASFREARSAVGAAKLLANALEYPTVAEAVADCRLIVGTTAAGRRELQHELRQLQDGGLAISTRLQTAPVALLFGSEKVGLSNDDMSHCHWLMRIPTRAEHGSMNLGQAAAVCLYELARTGGASGKSARKKKQEVANAADAAKMDRLTQSLFDVLNASGYVKPRVASATEEKIRRLVRRMNLNDADAELCLGMFRQIGWKLGVQADGPTRNQDSDRS
jgi:tRNA/rRNA methyltransferase